MPIRIANPSLDIDVDHTHTHAHKNLVSPFINKVERCKFPIDSRGSHLFCFRFLRHANSGDRVIRVFLIQFFEVRHFPFLSPLAKTQHNVFQCEFAQEKPHYVIRRKIFLLFTVTLYFSVHNFYFHFRFKKKLLVLCINY